MKCKMKSPNNVLEIIANMLFIRAWVALEEGDEIIALKLATEGNRLEAEIERLQTVSVEVK